MPSWRLLDVGSFVVGRNNERREQVDACFVLHAVVADCEDGDKNDACALNARPSIHFASPPRALVQGSASTAVAVHEQLPARARGRVGGRDRPASRAAQRRQCDAERRRSHANLSASFAWYRPAPEAPRRSPGRSALAEDRNWPRSLRSGGSGGTEDRCVEGLESLARPLVGGRIGDYAYADLLPDPEVRVVELQ
jgi:hypothetical protein